MLLNYTVVLEIVEMVVFQVGDTFSSITDLQEAIESYKSQNFCDIYTWDSQTIENAVQKGIRIPMLPQLKYYHIKYGCVTGTAATSTSALTTTAAEEDAVLDFTNNG